MTQIHSTRELVKAVPNIRKAAVAAKYRMLRRLGWEKDAAWTEAKRSYGESCKRAGVNAGRVKRLNAAWKEKDGEDGA